LFIFTIFLRKRSKLTSTQSEAYFISLSNALCDAFSLTSVALNIDIQKEIKRGMKNSFIK